ncbi:hypothetical protein MLD38_036258 [Melastoma candidum]|uniref:Uncharacterized protein n=1 Tax=Melastoma candidum TaxID=119954 RepID=A0ACB9LJP8_9MYRT|nr:hypothetical protein MLD38_036258 [Melastoma candidum]
MVSFDRDAFVEELLEISSAAGVGLDHFPYADSDVLVDDDGGRSSSMEEELEWISNKDAFPALETFLDVPPAQDEPRAIFEHGSPVSVLENSSLASSGDSGSYVYNGRGSVSVPVKARSKFARKRRRDGFREVPSSQAWEGAKVQRSEPVKAGKVGQKCLHCGVEKTPQWRAGPRGPKTLCNACGVRYKSGRLVPEYRPASSPTFSSELHSNSHRKIMEMRKVKGV